jgi:hypothetical protein
MKQGTHIFNYDLTRCNLHQFEPERNNLRSYTHGQLRLEQAKLATAWGVVSRNGWKTQVLLISTGLARAMQGVRLIVQSMTFATMLVSPT